jgi:hypothetical protein
MAVEYGEEVVRMREVVSVEEAEDILRWLEGKERPRIDLGCCTHLHAAVLQLLMATRPRVIEWPRDPDLRAWLERALRGEGGE